MIAELKLLAIINSKPANESLSRQLLGGLVYLHKTGQIHVMQTAVFITLLYFTLYNNIKS